MPLTAAPWWHFSRATVESDRDDPGVCEMGDASDNVVYIGSSDAYGPGGARQKREGAPVGVS
jgi:hypothetical protein